MYMYWHEVFHLSLHKTEKMALSSSSSSLPSPYALVALSLIVVLAGISSANNTLCEDYYNDSCPNLQHIVRSVVRSTVSKQPVLGAALLRLFFHDCFVNGCDASVLVDNNSTFKGEKSADPNKGSLRGFEVIDAIKSEVEAACPNMVSCADIEYIAARDSVALLGGPKWKVKLGRRDSRTVNKTIALYNLPSPYANLSTLISKFKDQGLSIRDLVALSGAHTIGQSRCVIYKDRIYNDTNIAACFAKSKQANCPINGASDNFTANLDIKTPHRFDNQYFKNLIMKKGLLHSDQELYNGGSTDSLVRLYSKNKKAFESDFVSAMIKMGDIKPLTFPQGEIRKNCRRVN